MELRTTEKDGYESCLAAAADYLLGGKVICYPTETFYALGGLYNDEQALRRIADLKDRPASKAFPLIIGDRALLSLVVSEINPLEEKIMDAFWPGPLTIVFKAREGLSRYIVDERNTVAVRMPGRSFALDLAERVRIPITATSANRTEMHPAKSAGEVIQHLPEGIDLLIDGGESTVVMPSTILEVQAGKVRLLREGVVPLSGIESVL